MASLYNVSTSITAEDAMYIRKILERSTTPETLAYTEDFDKQIDIILTVQQASFNAAPEERVIPLGRPREPKNLYEAKHAYCSDHARTIDKTLRMLGFNARFVSIYAKENGHSFLSTITTASSAERVHSHALVEVLTSKGWMIIDTRRRWISLTKDSTPVSLRDLQHNGYAHYQWSASFVEAPWPLLMQDFYILYGFYSRHGQFYAPYTRYIPDIHWPDFLVTNLID